MKRLKYKWTTQKQYHFKLPDYQGVRVGISTLDGTELGLLEPSGDLYIYKEYSWDGCTPKWILGSFTIGIWDGRGSGEHQELYEASMIHDILCQMIRLDVDGFGYTQKDIDKIFYNKAKGSGFPLPRTYYSFVRMYQTVSGWFK